MDIPKIKSDFSQRKGMQEKGKRDNILKTKGQKSSQNKEEKFLAFLPEHQGCVQRDFGSEVKQWEWGPREH